MRGGRVAVHQTTLCPTNWVSGVLAEETFKDEQNQINKDNKIDLIEYAFHCSKTYPAGISPTITTPSLLFRFTP